MAPAIANPNPNRKKKNFLYLVIKPNGLAGFSVDSFLIVEFGRINKLMINRMLETIKTI